MVENKTENIYLDCLVGKKGKDYGVVLKNPQKKKINNPMNRYMERKLDWLRVKGKLLIYPLVV